MHLILSNFLFLFFLSIINETIFRCVQIIDKISELNKFTGPMVVVCSMQSLFSGYAQDLFVEWASNPVNRIIFTDRSKPNTISRRLMENPKMGTLFMEVGYFYYPFCRIS